MALNHGVSLSFYFDDPEGHLIEVYWPTAVACLPLHGDPIDLTRSEETLWRDVAELAAQAGAPAAAGGAVVNAAADPDALGRQIVDEIPVTPCASERCARRSHRPRCVGRPRASARL
jgi:hypothetical protein